MRFRISYFDPFVKNIKIKNKTVRSLKEFDYKKLNEYEAIITNYLNTIFSIMINTLPSQKKIILID